MFFNFMSSWLLVYSRHLINVCRMNEYPMNLPIINDLPLWPQLPVGPNALGRTVIFHQVEIVEGAFSPSIEILLPSKCCQFGSNKFILIL